MCTGGENSLILIKLYIYVQVFYLEGRSPEKNVGHVIANSRTIRDLGESSFDSAICIRTVKLKSC